MDCTQRMVADDVADTLNHDEIGYLGICGKTHAIKMGPNKIGRDPDSCHIVIDNPSLSRQHAVINVLSATNFMLMDLGSVNKTKLGIKILQPYLPHNMKNGDTVQFGEVFGVFILSQVDCQLPMTQAFTVIPDTPVHTYPDPIRRLQATAIPESPDLNTSEEDSFILSSQQQGNSFHRPNPNAIKQKKLLKAISLEESNNESHDSIFWNASTRSPSINFNLEESESSINEGNTKMVEDDNQKCAGSKGDSQDLHDRLNVENIHEALTQLPSPPAKSTGTNIYETHTQILDNNTAKLNAGEENTMSNLQNIDIHKQCTQLDIVPEEKCIENINNLCATVSIHEAETQDFFNEKKICLSVNNEAGIRDCIQNGNSNEIFLINEAHDSIFHNNVDLCGNIMGIHEAATQKFTIPEKTGSVNKITQNADLQNVSDQKNIDIDKETIIYEMEMHDSLDEDTVLIDNSVTNESVNRNVDVFNQNQSTKCPEGKDFDVTNMETTKDASESDEEILFDEFETQDFHEKEQCSQVIPINIDIDDSTFKRKSNNEKQSPGKYIIISEKILEKQNNARNECEIFPDSDSLTDCEDIAMLSTQNIPTNVVIDDNDSTDCEEDSEKNKVICNDNDKTALVPETSDNIRSVDRKSDILDISEVPTQVLDQPMEIVIEHSYAMESAGKTIGANDPDDDFSDALTQVLPHAIPECPTQKIEDCSSTHHKIDEKLNMFKIPISSTPLNIKMKSPMCLKKEKNIISPLKNYPMSSPKISDDKFYTNTQELMDDLLTQKEDCVHNLSSINPNSPKVNDLETTTASYETNKKIDIFATPIDRQCYNTTQDIIADLLTQKVPEENQRHINRTKITANKLANKISQYSSEISDVESQDIDLLCLSKSSIPTGVGRSQISSVTKMLDGLDDNDEIIPSSQENDSIDENMRFPGITKDLLVPRNDAQKNDTSSSSSDGATAAHTFVASLSSQQVRDCIGLNYDNELNKTSTLVMNISTPIKVAKFSSDTSDNDNTPKKLSNQPKMRVFDVELPDSQEILRHTSKLPNCTIIETSSDSDTSPETQNTPVVHRRKVPSRRKKNNVDELKTVQLALPTRIITRKRSPTEKLSSNSKLKSIIKNQVLRIEEDENPLDYVNSEIINENLKRISNERNSKITKEEIKNYEVKADMHEKGKKTTTMKPSKESSPVNDNSDGDLADTVVLYTENLNKLINEKQKKCANEKHSNREDKNNPDYIHDIKTDKHIKRGTTRKTPDHENSQKTKHMDLSNFLSTVPHHSRTSTSRSQDIAENEETKKARNSSKSTVSSNYYNEEKNESNKKTQFAGNETNPEILIKKKYITKTIKNKKNIRKNINEQNEMECSSKYMTPAKDSQSSRENSKTKHSKPNDKPKQPRNKKQNEMTNQKLDESNIAEDVIKRAPTLNNVKSAKTKLIESKYSPKEITYKRNVKDSKQKEASSQNLDNLIIGKTSKLKDIKSNALSKTKLNKPNNSQDAMTTRSTRSTCHAKSEVSSVGNGTKEYTNVKSKSAEQEVPAKRGMRNKRQAPEEMEYVKKQPTKMRKVGQNCSEFGDSNTVLNQVSPHNTRKRPLTPVPIAAKHSTPKKMRKNLEDIDSQISPCIGRIVTPSRLSLRPKQNVMFTAFTGNKMEDVVKKLGATIVSDPLTCTVLVTQHIKRTVKFLCAVGLGRPIVGPNWIQACQDAKTLVDPWLYLLKDADTEKRFKFSLAKTLRGPRNFLAGRVVSATPSVLPAPHEMQNIVECSGGSWCDVSEAASERWLCLSTAVDSESWPTLRARGATIVSVEAVLSGVLQQALQVRAHTLK